MERKGFQNKTGLISHYYKKKFNSHLLSLLTFRVTSLCAKELRGDQD